MKTHSLSLLHNVDRQELISRISRYTLAAFPSTVTHDDIIDVVLDCIQNMLVCDEINMGDAAIGNDAERFKNVSCTSPANQSREISVVDPKINNAIFDKCVEALGQHDDEMNRWFLDEGNIRHFLAAYVTHAFPKTEPVSVSLEKCAEALAKQISIQTEGTDNAYSQWMESMGQIFRKNAKVVLNAAGVKYVD